MNAVDREELEAFREESADRLDRIARDLGRLAGTTRPAPELLQELFRETHSLKSGANLLHLSPVEALCHKLEDILAAIRSGAETPDNGLVDILGAGYARIRAFLQNPHVLPLVDVNRDLAEIDRRLQKRREAA